MQVERFQPRKKTNPLLIGCGCLFTGLMLMGVAVLLSLIFFQEPLIKLAASFVGAEVLGDVDTVLDSTAQPVPELDNPQPVQNVVLNAGEYSQTLDDSATGYTVTTGEVNEAPQLQISFDEAGLLAQCRQLTPICSHDTAQLRNASFDLKPNAVIIRGEFEALAWQSAGLVLLVQNENQLSVLGLEIGGTIIASDSPELDAFVADAGVQLNGLLQNLTAQAGGESYTLSSIIADETSLTLIMR